MVGGQQCHSVPYITVGINIYHWILHYLCVSSITYGRGSGDLAITKTILKRLLVQCVVKSSLFRNANMLGVNSSQINVWIFI